jgi:hypothetical protein
VPSKYRTTKSRQKTQQVAEQERQRNNGNYRGAVVLLTYRAQECIFHQGIDVGYRSQGIHGNSRRLQIQEHKIVTLAASGSIHNIYVTTTGAKMLGT